MGVKVEVVKFGPKIRRVSYIGLDGQKTFFFRSVADDNPTHPNDVETYRHSKMCRCYGCQLKVDLKEFITTSDAFLVATQLAKQATEEENLECLDSLSHSLIG